MAYATGHHAYKMTQVKTSSPGNLLLMLYDGAIKWCRQAVVHLRREENEAAHGALLKGQDIIGELMVALDFSVGGEVPQRLYDLYQYMFDRLVEANIKKEPQGITEVLVLLGEMRETWAEAAKMADHHQESPPSGLNIIK